MKRAYLVSLWDGVLDACCGLHVVRHGLIHSWGWGRGQDTMLESLGVASEAPLLGRKNRFLILQSPLHYELILVRAERPGNTESSARVLFITGRGLSSYQNPLSQPLEFIQ